MGSTTHIVDEDGIVLNHYEYDAWGNLTAQEEAVPNRFKFTGQQLDPVTQQYYLRARFYNPVIARFTQEDTYRGDGLNLYAYCTNNPILYADLTGHEKDLLSRHSNDSTFEERFNQNLQEELVFNKQRGLQTYYDTPQAKTQNQHIASNQAEINSKNSTNFKKTIEYTEIDPSNPFYKKCGGSNLDDFMTPHSEKHAYNPNETSTKKKTQFGQNVDVGKLREDTLLHPDQIVYDSEHNTIKYSKEYNFNISTPDTPTGSHRVFINLDSKPGKTNRNSQFPHYKGNSNGQLK